MNVSAAASASTVCAGHISACHATCSVFLRTATAIAVSASRASASLFNAAKLTPRIACATPTPVSASAASAYCQKRLKLAAPGLSALVKHDTPPNADGVSGADDAFMAHAVDVLRKP